MIICADARRIPLADETVQCVVTSPPYWGLRKYSGEQELVWGGAEGCGAWRGAFGLEPTVEMYVAHTVEILREIRRVLRKDGVVFWNVGDSYNAHPGQRTEHDKAGYKQATDRGSCESASRNDTQLKAKDLCLIPFRVALAAQADGWWVRSDIIWSKPNPMPESVTDRPTDAYEHILMLTRSAKYYWDAEAVKEAASGTSAHDLTGQGYSPPGQSPSNGNRGRGGASAFRGQGHFREGENGPANREGRDMKEVGAGVSRNLRNVWEFPTQPNSWAHCKACNHVYDSKIGLPRRKVQDDEGKERVEIGCSRCGAWGQWTEHFATFPEELPRRCIKSATSEKGACATCGAPWVRVVEKKVHFESGSGKAGNPPTGKRIENEQAQSGDYDIRMGPVVDSKTIGWRAGCECSGQCIVNSEEQNNPDAESVHCSLSTIPCLCLDPFGGSGTTAKVAIELGRRAVSLDLAYHDLAKKRTRELQPALAMA